MPTEPFTAFTKTSLSFEWDQPSINTATQIDIDSYKIYWDSAELSSGNFELLATVDSYDQVFYTAEGLTAGKYYRFQVSAVNAIGEGTLSAEFGHYAKALPGKPEAPVYVSSTEDSATEASVTLSWTALTDTGGVALTGYKVYHVKSSTTVLGYDGSGSPATTSCTITTLDLDSEYEFYVVGLNGDDYDEGEASDRLTLTAAALPDAPGAITESSRVDNQITLSWVAPTGDGGSAITAYTLSIVKDNEEDEVVYYGTSTSATILGLDIGTTYYFKVAASNAVGEGPESDYYGFLIVEPPSAPLNIETDSYDNSFVTFSWELPLSNGGQALSGFKVYRESCTDSTASPSLLATLNANQFSHTDSTVNGGECYQFFVKAYNALGGDGAQSSYLKLTPITVPTGMTAPTEVASTQTTISVQWAAPTSDGDDSVQYYTLLMKASYETTYSEIYSGLSRSYKATLLTTGFTYQFKVKAINSAGSSDLSSASSAILAAETPDSPTDLDLQERSDTAIKVSWTAPAEKGGVELTGYKVYMATGNGVYSE